MSDLVKRLRNGVAEFPVIIEHPNKLMKEAADRIEELEAQVRDKGNRIDHLEEFARKGAYSEGQARENNALRLRIEELETLLKNTEWHLANEATLHAKATEQLENNDGGIDDQSLKVDWVEHAKKLQGQLDKVLNAETNEYETRGNIKKYAVPLLVRDLGTVQQALKD